MERENILLGNFIISKNKPINVFVPAVSSKENIMTFLSKGLSNNFPNIFLVTWDQEEREDRICYQNVIKYVSENKNSLFILDDIATFILYAGDALGYPLNNNFFILLMDNLDSQKNTQIIAKRYNIVLWPSPCDLDISIDINERCVYMTGKQEKLYSSSILEFQKTNRDTRVNVNSESNIKKAEGFLNVYLEKENTLASLDIDEALRRSLKFKNIIISVLMGNKKRHIIRMIDGRYGIDSFASVYNRIDNKIELVIIKNTDPSSSKISKINMINGSTKPIIILTDCLLTKSLTPQNINEYHITNGGSDEDIIMIFSIALGNNYIGRYPRKINVNCHISKPIKNDTTTLDQYNFYSFNERMRYINKKKSIFRELGKKIFYKGEDLFVSVNNK